MTFQTTKNFLGGYPGTPGSTTLTPTTPPKYSSETLSKDTPISDIAADSEERIVFSVINVPHGRSQDGGESSEGLLQPGNVLFCVRSQPDDVRVSVLELSMVNSILAQKYKLFTDLFKKQVLILYQNAVQTSNMTEKFMSISEVKSLLPEGGITLEALCTMAGVFESVDMRNTVPFRSSSFLQDDGIQVAYLPSEFEVYSTFKSSNTTVQKIVAPHLSRDDTGAVVGFKPMKMQDLISKHTSVNKRQTIAKNFQIIDKFRRIIKFILASNADIVQYNTLEGVKDMFNYIGVFVSSQNDGTPEQIISSGQARNINISCRGKTETINRWGSKMLSETPVYLIIKRMRYTDGSFGEFFVQPYWSTDNVSTNNMAYPFGSDQFVDGPRNEGLCRRKCVPTHQTTFLDMSGKLCNGHVFYVGRTADSCNESEPHISKVTSLGVNLNVAPMTSANSAYISPIPNNYQKSYDALNRLGNVWINLGI